MGQLDVNFRRFYAKARKKVRELYSKSTDLGFRHSFERYLNGPRFNQGLNLNSDPHFKISNEMLNAQIVHLKRQGKENVRHKLAIKDEDSKSVVSRCSCSFVGDEGKASRGNSRCQVSNSKLTPLKECSSQ